MCHPRLHKLLRTADRHVLGAPEGTTISIVCVDTQLLCASKVIERKIHQIAKLRIKSEKLISPKPSASILLDGLGVSFSDFYLALRKWFLELMPS